MITLHRLGQPGREFQLNHDMIVTIEANPDTVITLMNGTKIVVAEAPEQVADEMRACRSETLALALLLQDRERRTTSTARRSAGTDTSWLEAIGAGGEHMPFSGRAPDLYEAAK